MDLNEQTEIQCFNCHQAIGELPAAEFKISGAGPTCENCLQYESNEVTTLQQHIKIMESELDMLQHTANEQSLQQIYCDQQLQKQLGELLSESERLEQLKQQSDRQARTLAQQLVNINQIAASEFTCLTSEQIALADTIAEIWLLQSSMQQAKHKKEELEKMSVLSKLYTIHFDDKLAYVNFQPITHENLKPILQIICNLMEKYNYSKSKVLLCEDSIIINNLQFTLNQPSPPATLIWLQLIIKQTLSLWEHIKQRAKALTHQQYDSYKLPCVIATSPQVSINGITLQANANYLRILKYFSHDIKFMIDFDFQVSFCLGEQGR